MHSCLTNCRGVRHAARERRRRRRGVPAARAPRGPVRSPLNRTHDCADECLDLSYLVAEFPDQRQQDDPRPQRHGGLAHYAYNVSNPPSCARNFTGNGSVDVEGAPDGRPREHLYFNVTEWAGDVLFYPECVERCYGGTQRCFDRYCVTNMEEPHEDEATCVPRCLQLRRAELRAAAAAAAERDGEPHALPDRLRGPLPEAAAANCSARATRCATPPTSSRQGARIAARRACASRSACSTARRTTRRVRRAVGRGGGGGGGGAVAASSSTPARTHDGRAEYLPERYGSSTPTAPRVYHSACYGNCSLDCARDCFVAVVGECVPEGGALDQRCVERQKRLRQPDGGGEGGARGGRGGGARRLLRGVVRGQVPHADLRQQRHRRAALPVSTRVPRRVHRQLHRRGDDRVHARQSVDRHRRLVQLVVLLPPPEGRRDGRRRRRRGRRRGRRRQRVVLSAAAAPTVPTPPPTRPPTPAPPSSTASSSTRSPG